MTEDRRRSATRDRLVRAATGLFRRQGVAATGINAVCERAGVTKGVFTHHFPGGKDELAAAVVAANGGVVADQLEAVAPGQSTGEIVTEIFDSYAALMNHKGHDFGCPVAASVIDGSASELAAAASRAAFARWRGALSARLGSSSEDDLDALVVAAIEGAILLARADEDPATVARVGRALAALMPEDEGPRR